MLLMVPSMTLLHLSYWDDYWEVLYDLVPVVVLVLASVPLMMPLVLCDANDSGIKWPEKSCCISLLSSWPKECNAISIMWHNVRGSGIMWWWHQWHHMRKSHIAPHFNCFDIDNAVSIMWYWCWCQWCPMIKNVILPLILIILTQGMQWCHWQYYLHCTILTQIPVASYDAEADANGIAWP